MRFVFAALMTLSLATSLASGQAAVPPTADSEPHPTLPPSSPWAGAVVISILGLFLAAAVIGPIVRSEATDDLPPA